MVFQLCARPAPNDSVSLGIRGLLSLTSVPPAEGPFVCLTVEQFRSLEAAAMEQRAHAQAPGPSSGPSPRDSTEIPRDEDGYEPDDDDPPPRKTRVLSFSERRIHVRCSQICIFQTNG